MTDWRSCSAVRDRDDDLWVRSTGAHWGFPGEYYPLLADDLESYYGPITPVLDADGLPVVTPAELAAAWDEGHDAGHEDARAVQSTYPEPTPNPYRAEGDPR